MKEFKNEELRQYSCCFFGHRKIKETAELKDRICKTIEDLILNHKVYIFLFGSKSQFDDLCHKVVTELKEKYSHIQRIYVRAAFPYINEDYEKYLLQSYEKTYCPVGIEKAGKAAYVERNCEMINKSCFCVIYCDEKYMPPRRKHSRRDLTDYQPKSGTKIAYEYAIKRGNKVINVLTV